LLPLCCKFQSAACAAAEIFSVHSERMKFILHMQRGDKHLFTSLLLLFCVPEAQGSNTEIDITIFPLAFLCQYNPQTAFLQPQWNITKVTIFLSDTRLPYRPLTSEATNLTK
jgi:hypothetical protein